MNEKDFEQIAQMVAQVIDKKLEPMNVRFDQIDARLEQFDARFDEMEGRFNARFEEMEGRFNARFEQMDAKVESFKSEIIAEFNHSLEIKSEALSHKMELLRDGVAYVTERVAEVNSRVKVIDVKVENLSLQFLAHRLDPDAHARPGGYRIKEEETGFSVIPLKKEEAEGAELKRRLEEPRSKYDAVTEEINAYCAEMGVELPKIDGEEVIRQIRLDSARYRVEQELKKHREKENKPE